MSQVVPAWQASAANLHLVRPAFIRQWVGEAMLEGRVWPAHCPSPWQPHTRRKSPLPTLVPCPCPMASPDWVVTLQLMCRRDENKILQILQYLMILPLLMNAAAVLLALYGPCGVKQYYFNTLFRAVPFTTCTAVTNTTYYDRLQYFIFSICKHFHLFLLFFWWCME